MEEQFNREAKEGWRFAASAKRITEETAGDEDRKHTSGGVFVALVAVVGAEEGAIHSISSNEGRWVNVREGLQQGKKIKASHCASSRSTSGIPRDKE